jgi:hypothetical protein
MTLILNILFFCQALIIFGLIISRSPARLPGFEKSRNESLDKIILGSLLAFIFILFQFKCR